MPDKLMKFIQGGGKGDYIDRAITAAGEGGSVMDRLSALPKEIARGALRTLLETRSADPETQIKAVTSLTGALAGRAVAFDKPAPNLVGMFVGRHSKTFDHAARDKAVGMSHDYATPEQIHAATGTHSSAPMGGDAGEANRTAPEPYTRRAPNEPPSSDRRGDDKQQSDAKAGAGHAAKSARHKTGRTPSTPGEIDERK